MKVLFYVDNKGTESVDWSYPEQGNPGIGGTQYMFWLVSTYLSRWYPEDEVYLAADNVETMPKDLKTVAVADCKEAIRAAQEMQVDVFVCRGPYLSEDIYGALEAANLKTVLWNHNFERECDAEQMAKCPAVRRLVCVGKEQQDRLRDHAVYAKTTYIYNAITQDLYDEVEKEEKIEKSVCFQGGLYPSKGFARLAKVWKQIEKQVPGAQLYIMGTGQLYNRDKKMGPYNLAEEDYERAFIKHLVDKNGSIRKNVHFLGNLGGSDKLKQMKKMQVGVVNPIGKGETFCISAIEFEALGVPVVTLGKYALVETVAHKKTGLLFHSNRGFVKAVVDLLQNTEKNRALGQQGPSFIREMFSLDQVIKRWHQVCEEVCLDLPLNPIYDAKHWGNMGKWLREGNRWLRKTTPFLPSILWYEGLPGKIRRGIRKVMRG